MFKHYFKFFQQGPKVTKMIVMANCGIYLTSLFMSHIDYIKTFLFHRSNLKNKSHLHTLITSHFTKLNIVELLIDGIVVAQLGKGIELLIGPSQFGKLVLCSAALGSAFLISFHKENNFIRSDAILRGMLMYFVFKNPNASFMLMPFPIEIKAAWLGMFITTVDILGSKWVNFGGTLAGLLVSKNLI